MNIFGRKKTGTDIAMSGYIDNHSGQVLLLAAESTVDGGDEDNAKLTSGKRMILRARMSLSSSSEPELDAM